MKPLGDLGGTQWEHQIPSALSPWGSQISVKPIVCRPYSTWHKALAQDERMANEKARVGGKELLLVLPFLISVFLLCKEDNVIDVAQKNYA